MSYQAEKQELAAQLCRAAHAMAALGYAPANAGNLSARCPDGHILITPSGVSKGDLTPDMILEIDREGNRLDDKPGRPSVERQLHLAVLNSQPDLMCVIHAHPPCAVALSAAGEDLDRPVTSDACLLGIVPAMPYAQLGTRELAANMERAAGEYNAALMAHHGACAWGRTVQEARFHMELLEALCQQICLRRVTGIDAMLDREQSDRLIAQRIREGKRRGGEHMPPLE